MPIASEPTKIFTATLASTTICLGFLPAAYSSGAFSLEVVGFNAEGGGCIIRELLTNEHLFDFSYFYFHVHLDVLYPIFTLLMVALFMLSSDLPMVLDVSTYLLLRCGLVVYCCTTYLCNLWVGVSGEGANKYRGLFFYISCLPLV